MLHAIITIVVIITVIITIVEIDLCFEAADDPLVALLHPHVHVVVGVYISLQFERMMKIIY